MADGNVDSLENECVRRASERNLKRARSAWSYAVAHYRFARRLRKDRDLRIVLNFQTVFFILCGLANVSFIVWVRPLSIILMTVYAEVMFAFVLDSRAFYLAVSACSSDTEQCRLHREMGHAYKAACGFAVRLLTGRTTSEYRFRRSMRIISWRYNFIDRSHTSSSAWQACLRKGRAEAEEKVKA